MKKTMMSNLPRDLSEEVLCRIPMTSLKKVRSTCKKWNTLSRNSFFAKKHLAQEAKVAEEAKGEFMVVVMMDYSLYLMGVNLSDKDVESCSIKRQSKLIYPGSDQIEVSRVFHCDGLLLCVSKDHTRLVVWNPYCGKPLWIEPTHRRYNYLYALGYDKSKDSHKILRFGGSVDFTIYDLNSDSVPVSERVLDITTPDWMEYNDHSSVTLNGNAYWHATKVEDSDNRDQNFLVCFDFTRETFGPRLPLPFEHVFVDVDTVSLSVVRGRGGEKLAVLFQPCDSLKVEIWVTSKIEPDALTWESKVFLKVSLRQTIHPQFQFFIRGASFFIDEEKKVAIIIDKEFDRAVQPTRHQAYIIGVDGSLKKVDLGESSHKHNIPLACSYLPSLIQPN